jgi:hypothetical protein
MLKTPKRLRNQKGLATIEIIPIMIVIALLLNFALGFFGVIHTGILNSIAARNYTFETFRHRANLMYFHDVRGNGHYKRYNARLHGIVSEVGGGGRIRAFATERPIGFGMAPEDNSSVDVHEGGAGRGIESIQAGLRNSDIDSSPVWVKPQYGICLNAKCSQ